MCGPNGRCRQTADRQSTPSSPPFIRIQACVVNHCRRRRRSIVAKGMAGSASQIERNNNGRTNGMGTLSFLHGPKYGHNTGTCIYKYNRTRICSRGRDTRVTIPSVKIVKYLYSRYYPGSNQRETKWFSKN